MPLPGIVTVQVAEFVYFDAEREIAGCQNIDNAVTAEAHFEAHLLKETSDATRTLLGVVLCSGTRTGDLT